MLRRKVTPIIEEYLRTPSNKMLIVEGARQIGKSYIVRHIGSRLYPNFIEINMERDRQHDRLFAEAKTVEAFYLTLSSIAGDKMGSIDDTLVFIDEIQAYDHLLTLAKFLMEDGRFRYIASGSLLGVTLRKTNSIPIGSIQQLHMWPLDFEEFLWANEYGELAISHLRECFENNTSVAEAIHNKTMELFRRYLLVGGMPDAINVYLAEHNIQKVRQVQSDIIDLYKSDAAKYESVVARKLQIQRIYEMIPSNLESRRKRIVAKAIENKVGKRTSDYQEEFEYLVSSGIALEVDAISQPTYPLVQNSAKNLLKLYLNDVGLLSGIYYGYNIKPILDDIVSINLGSVYEAVVAQELAAHEFHLFYYDNKKIGEVDFLIDDRQAMTALPIEAKSGKDYTSHNALNRFMQVSDYHVQRAYVLSNARTVEVKDHIIYTPIYNLMFFHSNPIVSTDELTF